MVRQIIETVLGDETPVRIAAQEIEQFSFLLFFLTNLLCGVRKLLVERGNLRGHVCFLTGESPVKV